MGTGTTDPTEKDAKSTSSIREYKRRETARENRSLCWWEGKCSTGSRRGGGDGFLGKKKNQGKKGKAGRERKTVCAQKRRPGTCLQNAQKKGEIEAPSEKGRDDRKKAKPVHGSDAEAKGRLMKEGTGGSEGKNCVNGKKDKGQLE